MGVKCFIAAMIIMAISGVAFYFDYTNKYYFSDFMTFILFIILPIAGIALLQVAWVCL